MYNVLYFFYVSIGALGNNPFYNPNSGTNVTLPNIYTGNQNIIDTNMQQPFHTYIPGKNTVIL